MDYIIKDTFQIASKGEQVDATTISLKSPNGKVYKYVSRIDQEISKAIMTVSEKEFKTESQKESDSSLDSLSGEELIFMLSSSGFDIEKCIDNFKWILKLTSFVNEQYQITDTIVDKISYRDIKDMMGGYIKDFLFISQVS
ncbi:MAG: hypothetical protein JSU91_01870 [Thermoplasmatales archaeon]|nr:MAG: hypothetical protein JSU91_01870 [Thermoplasmatales archaeon]